MVQRRAANRATSSAVMLPPTVSVSASNDWGSKKAELLIRPARSVDRDFDTRRNCQDSHRAQIGEQQFEERLDSLECGQAVRDIVASLRKAAEQQAPHDWRVDEL